MRNSFLSKLAFPGSGVIRNRLDTQGGSFFNITRLSMTKLFSVIRLKLAHFYYLSFNKCCVLYES